MGRFIPSQVRQEGRHGQVNDRRQSVGVLQVPLMLRHHRRRHDNQSSGFQNTKRIRWPVRGRMPSGR